MDNISLEYERLATKVVHCHQKQFCYSCSEEDLDIVFVLIYCFRRTKLKHPTFL